MADPEALEEIRLKEMELRSALERDKRINVEAARITRAYLRSMDEVDQSGDEVDDLLTTVKKLHCRALCQKILRTLPKELRDMVYIELLEANEEPCVFPSLMRERNRHPYIYMPTSITPPGFLISDRVSDDLEHWFDVDFVGTEFLKELAECWYGWATLCFDRQYDELRTFMASGLTDIGLRPSGLFTALRIEMDVATDFFEWSANPSARYSDSIKRCLRNLRRLSDIPHRVTVTIKLVATDASPLRFRKGEPLDEPQIWPEYGIKLKALLLCFTDVHSTILHLQNHGHAVKLATAFSSLELLTMDPFPQAWMRWIYESMKDFNNSPWAETSYLFEIPDHFKDVTDDDWLP